MMNWLFDYRERKVCRNSFLYGLFTAGGMLFAVDFLFGLGFLYGVAAIVLLIVAKHSQTKIPIHRKGN